MENSIDGVNRKDANDRSQQTTSATPMSNEQMKAWQAHILEMTRVQTTKLQNLLSVQTLLLQGDIEGAILKCQEDPSMFPSSSTVKHKSSTMQDLKISGVESQADIQFHLGKSTNETREGRMKMPVAETGKNLQSNEGNLNEALGIREPCHCCRHYGLSCLQNKSSDERVEASQKLQTQSNKKRKAVLQELLLRSKTDLNSISQLGLDAIPQQIPQHIRKLDAPSCFMPEICVDGWTITYKEFQPQNKKQVKRQASGGATTKDNPQNQSTSNTQAALTNVVYYRCAQEGHYAWSCPLKNQPLRSIPATQSTSIQEVQHQVGTLKRSNSKSCHHCFEEGHVMWRCPKKYPQIYGNNKQKRIHKHGGLDHVELNTVYEDPTVVFGPILVNQTPAIALFDPGSSHSFISSKCVADQKMLMLPKKKPIPVKTPRGKTRVTHLCPKVNLNIKGTNFEVDLVVLESLEIDVVLGRWWFSTYHASINQFPHSVSLTTPSGERIEFENTQDYT